MATLLDTYDGLLLDLDGTVWAEGTGIGSAVDVVNSCGVRAIYITNNASRSPEKVAAMLREINIPARAEDVLTSAQAAVSYAVDTLPHGAKVLVIGADSFRSLARAAGLSVVSSADDHPAAVLQGFDPSIGWSDLTEAALAIAGGAIHIASNLDASLPTQRGFAVGNGSLVKAVVSVTGREPVSTGKPGPEMFRQAAHRLGSKRPLAVGDRLDTDILGGNNAAMDSFVVLTGVTGPLDLFDCPVDHRPTYIGQTLADLSLETTEAAPGAQGGFRARVDGDDILLEGGYEDSTSVQALRTVLEVAWQMPQPPALVRPMSDAAEQATAQWH